LLGFLTIFLPSGYGFARWESGRTFNGLTIYCVSSKILQYPLAKPPYTQGSFVVSIGFKNPNLFPVDVAWSATPLLNNSNYFSGFLQDTVPGFGNHIATMSFAFIPALANYTLNKVVSYERYSILQDIFSEPRIFFISSDQIIPLGNNVMNLTANRMPDLLWFIFIQHSNLLQSQQALCNPNGTP
jgi:hypothetical protein